MAEIRSILPNSVGCMALTATATKASSKIICCALSMHDPVLVYKSPNKPNIAYHVKEKKGDTEEMLQPLIKGLIMHRSNMERVIIFCQTYNYVTRIFYCMKSQLKGEMLEPTWAPDLVKYRLFDMYTACTYSTTKEAIVKTFCDANSPLRVIIATIAFGMGLDCPIIRRVIHWGPPDIIESYLQETGRAGRDGLSSKATLFFSKKLTTSVMK